MATAAVGSGVRTSPWSRSARDVEAHLTRRLAARLADGRPRHDGLPPGPASPPVAQMLGFLFLFGPFLEAGRERFGPAITLRFPGMAPLIQFSEAEAIKQVFADAGDAMHAGKANGVLEPFLGAHSVLVLDGARHRSQRRLLLPPFRGERMRAYGDAMREITRAAMARWPRDERVVAQQLTQDITLDVILRTVFGMEDGADQDRMRALLVEGLRIIDNPMFLVRGFQRDLGPRSPWGRFRRLQRDVAAEMDALIARRRQEGPGEDILSILLEATHEDGAPMANAEIRDELMTLLVAGHETTATALSWTLHRLSIHPEVLRRVQAELDDAFGSGPVDPGADLPYLDAVARETLRVHPVIGGVGRRLEEPATIGGVDLPAGVMVGCSIYLVHHDPERWPDPERFDPSRFLGKKPPPHAYFPFGGGIRRCIGEAFALFETRVVLATVLRQLEPVAVARRVRTQRRNITLTPAGGLPLRLRPR